MVFGISDSTKLIWLTQELKRGWPERSDRFFDEKEEKQLKEKQQNNNNVPPVREPELHVRFLAAPTDPSQREILKQGQ